MATILEKKYTSKDSKEDILKAIITLAEDKHGRLMLQDQVDWLETKLGEIARLSKLLQKRTK